MESIPADARPQPTDEDSPRKRKAREEGDSPKSAGDEIEVVGGKHNAADGAESDDADERPQPMDEGSPKKRKPTEEDGSPKSAGDEIKVAEGKQNVSDGPESNSADERPKPAMDKDSPMKETPEQDPPKSSQGDIDGTAGYVQAASEDDDDNDDEFDPDECFICFDGGDLLCCDYCERAYHLKCHRPRLTSVPEGQWKCMECRSFGEPCGSCPSCKRSTDCGKCPFCTGKPTPEGRCKLRLCTNPKKDPSALSPRKRKQPHDTTNYKGARIAKRFARGTYFGTIIDRRKGFWRIRYDDGDEEDYDDNDVDKQLRFYEKHMTKDPNPKLKAAKESRADEGAADAGDKRGNSESPVAGGRRTVLRSESREETQAPRFCVVEVPRDVAVGDALVLNWPNGLTTRVNCPPGVEFSPYILVVAPGSEPPYEAKVVARDNASQLNHGLQHGFLRPTIVGAFTNVLWPALEAEGWRMIDARASNTGTIYFVPPGVNIRDRNMVLGREYFSTYDEVMKYVAKTERYSEAFKAFKKYAELRKAAAVKEAAEKRRLKKLEREKHYLSETPAHDTPVGPDHQVINLPKAGSFSGSQPQIPSDRFLRSPTSCGELWDPERASSLTYAFLDDIREKKYDVEAAMEMIRCCDYSIDGVKEIIEQTAPPEVWSEHDEQLFCMQVRKNHHDIKRVANSLGRSIECCLWYYYHHYRPRSQWSDDKRKAVFHDNLVDTDKDLQKTSKSMGTRLDSCLYYFYSEYRSSGNYKILKEAMKAKAEADIHDDYCAVCDDGGDLICCTFCPSAYHLDCSSLDAVPEGDWKCVECVAKNIPTAESGVSLPESASNIPNNSAASGEGSTDAGKVTNESGGGVPQPESNMPSNSAGVSTDGGQELEAATNEKTVDVDAII